MSKLVACFPLATWRQQVHEQQHQDIPDDTMQIRMMVGAVAAVWAAGISAVVAMII